VSVPRITRINSHFGTFRGELATPEPAWHVRRLPWWRRGGSRARGIEQHLEWDGVAQRHVPGEVEVQVI
jgi:hypothetical protein